MKKLLVILTSPAWFLILLSAFPYIVHASTEQVCENPVELAQRQGMPIITSGRVPHVQLGVTPNIELNTALNQFAFSLPGVISRPTIVSLPGATGMWLSEGIPVVQPRAIVSGREFAHIHPDGSLHAPLPLDRALELEQKGWGERHPWATTRAGWDGLVMLYSALTETQLETLKLLVAESYSHITGQEVTPPHC